MRDFLSKSCKTHKLSDFSGHPLDLIRDSLFIVLEYLGFPPNQP
nr:MAG TPA: hypothetical protein [Caudoviricetes sp.]